MANRSGAAWSSGQRVTSVPVRRRLTADARREQLLEAALVEFGLCGSHVTLMEHVAARAGVSKATLHPHFPSKAQSHSRLLVARYLAEPELGIPLRAMRQDISDALADLLVGSHVLGRLTGLTLRRARLQLVRVAYFAMTSLVNPQVCAAVGLAVAEAVAVEAVAAAGRTRTGGTPSAAPRTGRWSCCRRHG